MFPGGLTLGRLGGISGTATTAGTYNFTVQVTDSVNSTAMTNLRILINAAPPLIVTTTALSNGTAGAAYPSTNLQASGGVPPYAWSVTTAATTFPPGLTLSSAGQITGTPTAAATYNFTVQVKDSQNATATANLSILVNPGPTLLTITTTSSQLPTGTVSTAYPATNLTASGGTPPYAWTLASAASTFPGGLTLGRLGGISGTATTAGTYNFTVQVTDSVNSTAMTNLRILINAAPPLIVTATALPNGTAGAAYPSTNLQASGGVPPYAWSVTTAATTFPPGLTLSSTGQITGTPTAAATYNFTVQVKDSQNATATANLSILVNPGPTLLTITTTSSQLPTGTVSTAYPATNLTASGGTPPYAWTLASAASTFPGGLTLGRLGGISGTATTAGTYNFTVQVTDSVNSTAMTNLRILINAAPPLIFTTTALSNGTAGAAYPSTNLQASGGVPPYAWSVTTAATTFPPGLTLSSTGQITGTPTAAATYNFTVQVKDLQNATASANLSILVNPGPTLLTITTTSSQLPTGTVSTAYPATNLTASGGT